MTQHEVIIMRRAIVVIVICVAFGCSRAPETARVQREGAAPLLPGSPPPNRPDGGRAPEQMADAAADGEPEQPAGVQRRVIRNANLDLIVDDFDKVRQELERLVEESQGFVAGSDTGGSPGSPRSGRWTVRVPATRFTAFVEAVARLGEAVRNHTDAQDVTDQFVDLEARLKNKRIEEERLLEHLKTSTGKLEDILTVERELSRVRGEIEQTQGRMKKLSDLSGMGTVTVALNERRGYVPPQAPAFGTTVGRTFSDSLGMLVNFGKGLLLVVVALAPWLPVIGVISVGSWLVWRRWSTSMGRPLPGGVRGDGE